MLCKRSMFSILISSTGLSPFSVLTFSMLRTTSAPFDTRPNTVCLLSSHGVGTVVTKNCKDRAQIKILAPRRIAGTCRKTRFLQAIMMRW